MKYLIGLVMLIVSMITWSTHLAISIVLWILGWPICLYLGLTGQVVKRSNSLFPNRLLTQWKPRWAYIYCNDEDGIDGLRGSSIAQKAWAEQTKELSPEMRVLKWSCWRNPVGNLRFIVPFGFRIKPWKIEYVGNSMNPDKSYAVRSGFYWYFAWHEFYTGFWVIAFGFQTRLGWKILPEDRNGLSDDDYRKKGCGFALQFQRK